MEKYLYIIYLVWLLSPEGEDYNLAPPQQRISMENLSNIFQFIDKEVFIINKKKIPT